MKNIVHFETLGCRLNQDETEGAARCFSNAGFISDLDSISSKSELNSSVFLGVINTCTVTGKAEQKARRIIRLMLEKFPEATLIVTGCYAELDGDEIACLNPDRICILPGEKKSILSKIAEEAADGELSVEKNLFTKENLQKFIQRSLSKNISALNKFTLYTPVFEKHSRSSLKIQDGCNNNCSFCRIHLARGKAVSLGVKDAVSRARELEAEGAVEIVLTGVNLSQYAGKKEDGGIASFSELLSALIAGTSKVKFRVSSFYPQHVTEQLCEVLASDRVQPFFHLSIQSGSERILEKMCRPYKIEHVNNAIGLLRKTKPGCFISCDIIAGFPTETEEDFNFTEKLCRESNFAWIHAFPYSPRPGTAAKDMKPQVPENVKNERVRILTDYAVNGKINFIKSCISDTFAAVVENSRSIRLGLTASNVFHAVTDNFIHVEFTSGKFIPQGSVVSVKIMQALEENIRSGKEIEARAVLANE